MDTFSYQELYSVKDRWLKSLREVAESGDIMQTQKGVLSLLYRWGQLNNNDYSEPQAWVMRLSADKGWLQNYLKLFYNETKFEEMLAFIPNEAFLEFVDRIKALAVGDKHASAVADFLHRIQEERGKKEDN